MKQLEKQAPNRRSFLKNGMLAAGVATAGVGIAILQLLLAAEIIETDLWQRYRELGGVEAMGRPSQGYITALEQLDGDMPQYISDNTDDEISHVAFLRAYLKSKGQRPINLDKFRNLSGSAAPGARDESR